MVCALTRLEFRLGRSPLPVPARGAFRPWANRESTTVKLRLAILGSTGSIGQQTLRVAEHLRERIEVVGLTAGTRHGLVAEQAAACGAGWVMAHDAEALSRQLPPGCRVLSGQDELCEELCGDGVDMVLCAVVGTAALRPVLAAVQAGKTLALASKEILVTAGSVVQAAARQSGARILPVDSEHCAIFQCLQDHAPAAVERILLTASGGPFFRHPEMDLVAVTPAQAMRHPTWQMGQKVTLDSATLMNKGLELIEAHWLFGLPEERIAVVIHPQSIVHSMVEYRDGSVLAQLSCPDMTLPIQYCLTYPERCPGLTPRLDFGRALQLDFLPPDDVRFPALRLARRALQVGAAGGAVFHSANEAAVELFCSGRIRFTGISRCVEAALAHGGHWPGSDLQELQAAGDEARRWVLERGERC